MSKLLRRLIFSCLSYIMKPGSCQGRDAGLQVWGSLSDLASAQQLLPDPGSERSQTPLPLAST